MADGRSLIILGHLLMQVSCGGQHMLVLATPRSPEDHLDGPDPESYYTDLNYNQTVPLSALAARARHRAKVRTSITVCSLKKLCCYI